MEGHLNTFIERWSALILRQKLMLVSGAITFFVVFALLARMALSPSYALLYSGLENGAAGDVVTVLEQRAVAYEIRGDSIFVPQSERDQLRMTLASEGLPKSGPQGYEILDNLSGFGTTSQMFDAAYWRAKEGELARSIITNPNIKSARVHISNTSNLLLRGRNPAKASISLSTTNGLTPQQAKALRYLVSSAVAGLDVSNVAVIDDESGLIAEGETIADPQSLDQRADILKARVERLLEARVGFNHAIVEVNVEADFDQESITERLFDPKGRVAVSTQSVETTKASQNDGSPAVGVASNVPDKQNSNGNGSQSSDNETRETINYEISETQRELVKTPGAIKRLSVAVMIDRNGLYLSEGVTLEDEITALTQLVSSAVGLDSARGDSLTIKTMDFSLPSEPSATTEAGYFTKQTLDLNALIQLAAFVLVALITALFIIRPLISKPGSNPLEGELVLDEGPQTLLPPDQTSERLRALIGEKQDETIDILKTWLDDTREKAS